MIFLNFYGSYIYCTCTHDFLISITFYLIIIIVFSKENHVTCSWNYFQVGDKLLEDMDRLEALKIALTTWAHWVDNNINPSTTSVFYQGVAVPHQK